MTKREFLDKVFALAPNEANAIMDAFDEYVDSNEPHWIPVTKEEMFKAGYDGREIIFKVDGRLFAIRELAQ
jgi:hypothetical protein